MALVDTGSTISVVHPTILEQSLEGRDVDLGKGPGHIRLADGSLVSTLGAAAVNVETTNEGTSMSHSMVVAAVESLVIIGVDFLRAYQCTLNLRTGTLSFGGRAHSGKQPDSMPRLLRVTTGEQRAQEEVVEGLSKRSSKTGDKGGRTDGQEEQRTQVELLEMVTVEGLSNRSWQTEEKEQGKTAIIEEKRSENVLADGGRNKIRSRTGEEAIRISSGEADKGTDEESSPRLGDVDSVEEKYSVLAAQVQGIRRIGAVVQERRKGTRVKGWRESSVLAKRRTKEAAQVQVVTF